MQVRINTYRHRNRHIRAYVFPRVHTLRIISPRHTRNRLRLHAARRLRLGTPKLYCAMSQHRLHTSKFGSFQECDAVSLGEWLPMVETSTNTRPTTRRHIPEHSCPHQHNTTVSTWNLAVWTQHNINPVIQLCQAAGTLSILPQLPYFYICTYKRPG